MRKRQISSGVHEVVDEFPAVRKMDVTRLLAEIPNTPKRRSRICCHKTNTDRLHEMFMAFDNTSYFPPSRHIGKEESLHILEGDGRYVFFDKTGMERDVIELGPYGSDYQFYCRIPAGMNHALEVDSNTMMIQETTTGPFRPEDTVLEPVTHRAPKSDLRHIRERLAMASINPEAFTADSSIVSVGMRQIEFLKCRVISSPRKRVRLCCHKSVEDALHEMFVVYTGQTYVRPNKHIGKDESLHILEGLATFIFFDDAGNIREVIPLGPYGSGFPFYVRVPAGCWHTLVMQSDMLVIHESTPGPFRREDTLWAPMEWAPDEADTSAVIETMNTWRSL